MKRAPGRINPRRNTPKHIVIKLTKIKDRDKILKAMRERSEITHKGSPIRLSADFSMEFYKPEANGMIYLSDEREETTTKNILPNKT